MAMMTKISMIRHFVARALTMVSVNNLRMEGGEAAITVAKVRTVIGMMPILRFWEMTLQAYK